jgi:hypothetical protein
MEIGLVNSILRLGNKRVQISSFDKEGKSFNKSPLSRV